MTEDKHKPQNRLSNPPTIWLANKRIMVLSRFFLCLLLIVITNPVKVVRSDNEEVPLADEERGTVVEEEEELEIQLNEEDRIAEYEKRGYKWPIPDEIFIPNTTGWKQLMRRRLEQVTSIEDSFDRYVGYSQILSSSVLIQNFTEHGFGLARCADEALMDELREVVRKGIPTAKLESRDPVIPGPNGPLLIDTHPDLLERVLYEMQSYAETWSGMDLEPVTAYGFRVYRNESQLYMHVDRPQTHVISFILHIGSSDDAEPWPLFIEDYHGQTHEVTLTSGDLLFYESSKLLHGRPKPLNGSWYSSVFVHYYPKNIGWEDRDLELEGHYIVPPIWSSNENVIAPETGISPKLKLIETSFIEPECVNLWCASQKSIRWGGPGEVGVWIAPTLQRYPFDPPPFEDPFFVEDL